MKIYGRKLLDNHREQHSVDFDDLVFEVGGREIVVSIYRARIDGRIEIRANDGVLVLLPQSANVAEIESRRL